MLEMPQGNKDFSVMFPVKDITVDNRMSIREREDEETIKRYEDSMESLPPIIVFHADDKYILADGFHRLAAAERLGWEYIKAEVREGTYQDAAEFAVKANLKHGKPLTPAEYEMALRRLKYLHEDWTQEKMARTLNRSRTWVSQVLAAHSVEKMSDVTGLDTSIKTEISKAPKPLWSDIGSAAKEQEWTVEETRARISEIKAEPERSQEIIHPARIKVPEAPADKLMPLTKEIKKLYEMQDELSDKFDPSKYEWGSGALAVHVLQGLYVLADKTIRLAENTKKMIEFLEERGKGKESTTPPLRKGSPPQEVKMKREP